MIRELYDSCNTGTHARMLYIINNVFTPVVAQWLERSPRKREVVGSIPDHVIPKTL